MIEINDIGQLLELLYWLLHGLFFLVQKFIEFLFGITLPSYTPEVIFVLIVIIAGIFAVIIKDR
jgi:hypothetical protein